MDNLAGWMLIGTDGAGIFRLRLQDSAPITISGVTIK